MEPLVCGVDHRAPRPHDRDRANFNRHTQYVVLQNRASARTTEQARRTTTLRRFSSLAQLDGRSDAAAQRPGRQPSEKRPTADRHARFGPAVKAVVGPAPRDAPLIIEGDQERSGEEQCCSIFAPRLQPRSRHWGGWYERQIPSPRRSLGLAAYRRTPGIEAWLEFRRLEAGGCVEV